MSYDIKQSTTAYPLVFLMVQSADHITALTGASPTVTLSKAGGSFASPSGAVTEIANGWYKVAGNSTDTGTLGSLVLHATAASGDPTDMIYNVVAYDPQDATALGLADIDATISSRATPAQILTTALSEAYSTLHGTMTLSQLLFEVRSILAEKAISGTTVTAKKLDGSTTAETFTLNDATSPTSITRAT